jgi:hypothetical protein
MISIIPFIIKVHLDIDKVCWVGHFFMRLDDVIQRILTQELGLRRMNFREITHKLTADEKDARVIS